MSKKISQFQDAPSINGEEYLIIANADVDNYKLKIKNLIQDSITSDSNSAVSSKVLFEKFNQKQDTLISGINIKTINNDSIVGEGNLFIAYPNFNITPIYSVTGSLLSNVPEGYLDYISSNDYARFNFISLNEKIYPAQIEFTPEQVNIKYTVYGDNNDGVYLEVWNITIDRTSGVIEGTREQLQVNYTENPLMELFTSNPGVEYNTDLMLYSINGIMVDHQEMLTIYNAGKWLHLPTGSPQYQELKDLKTNLPIPNESEIIYDGEHINSMYRCFSNCSELIVVKLYMFDNTIIPVNDMAQCFYNCSNLQKVYNTIDVSSITDNSKFTDCFTGCYELVDINLKGLNASINLQDCSNLSYDSLNYICRNAINNDTIEICLHQDIYNKLSNYTEQEQEWSDLLQYAISNKISFTTNVI